MIIFITIYNIIYISHINLLITMTKKNIKSNIIITLLVPNNIIFMLYTY